MIKQKMTWTCTASVLTAAVVVLVIASLAPIGIMQTNNAAAAGGIILKTQYKGGEYFAEAEKTIQEGSIETKAYPDAGTTTSGDKEICVILTKYDSNAQAYTTGFFGCGAPDQLTINGFNSATWSGTITGTDYVTGEEKTVIVNADLTGTGKPEVFPDPFHILTSYFNVIGHGNGIGRSASGSLNINRDLTFSTDDASGGIAKLTAGETIVRRG